MDGYRKRKHRSQQDHAIADDPTKSTATSLDLECVDTLTRQEPQPHDLDQDESATAANWGQNAAN